jgi:DNA-binding transcriptional ArsR family regulator
MDGDPIDWDKLLTLLLHETQLHIIEAMWRIGRPVSASQLVQVFDESVGLAAIAYHVRRLKQMGVIKPSWRRKVRGARERFYRIAVSER